MRKHLVALLIALSFSCQKESSYTMVDSKTVIDFDTVTKENLNRGILTLKSSKLNEYNLNSDCELIYKDTFPSWIEDYHGPDYSTKKYHFRPQISDIQLPYIIYKRKDDNYIQIIKNSDTLKFKLLNDL